MSKKKTIKYGLIQPLTGGVAFGARSALGKPADWVLSYPGLSDVKLDDSGAIASAGNEYGLLKWCKDHNELPPYQLFNKAPFQSTDFNVDIIDDKVWSTTPVDYSDTDLVVSVPVCSGLSQATIAPQETKDTRNCNMLWNAEFTLSKIKPKIYIFENAPALFSDTGSKVRDELNALAAKYNYAIVYYKTDTKLHDNCQRRPRTFVLFIKDRDGKLGTPDFNYENKPCPAGEFFDRIPKDATQQVTVELSSNNKIFLGYVKHKFGDNYREKMDHNMIKTIVRDNLYEDARQFAKNSNHPKEAIDKFVKTMDHIEHKRSMGKNFYSMIANFSTEELGLPAVIFRTIPTQLHFKEDRLFTIRELLHAMGMPHDYELQGNIQHNYAKIGQNVPGRTAQWIVSEAVRIIENWDTIERNNGDILFVDNTKQKTYSK